MMTGSKIGGLATIVGCFLAVSSLSASETTGSSLTDRDQLVLHRLYFCDPARKLAVPAQLIAAVFLAENNLNRDWKDTIQDVLFAGLIKYRDDKWWSIWADRAMEESNRAESTRLISNKWPIEVVATGIVFSIGPAQITPRTALIACGHISEALKSCAGGAKGMVESLMNEDSSIEIAAAVLRYERDIHFALTGVDLSEDLARWATVYNFGGKYYRNATNHGERIVNLFGRWVESHIAEIEHIISCSNPLAP